MTRPGFALLALALAPAAARGAERATTTPIRHVVVVFQENVSFDHYFATYPEAANPPGEPPFQARPGTPTVNGLGELARANPNAAAPFRLDRAQAATCDQDHGYRQEQAAYHAGLLDRFELLGSRDGGSDGKLTCHRREVMGYFDGNTVTALWNYAQRFAMSDQHFGTTYGPSAPGALNLVAGNTHGATVPRGGAPESDVIEGTLIGDARPFLDDCSPHGGRSPGQVVMTGRNVGDLLEAAGVSWGWFQGGFRPTARRPDGTAVCGASHAGSDGQPKEDYIPHHEPFQYYPRTANPHHLPPTSVESIGRKDPANHQYDLADFRDALAAGRLPAVSFLKAPGYQDGHAGYSDPLAEQRFLVETMNALQRSPEWSTTAVFLAWDDSDGWYDHVMAPVVRRSSTSQDALTGPGACGRPRPGEYPGRCGYGPRLPLLVLSPWARPNFVDHRVTDQSSILRFIEDNWALGRVGDQSADATAGTLLPLFDFESPARGSLLLDPETGEPLAAR